MQEPILADVNENIHSDSEESADLSDFQELTIDTNNGAAGHDTEEFIAGDEFIAAAYMYEPAARQRIQTANVLDQPWPTRFNV